MKNLLERTADELESRLFSAGGVINVLSAELTPNVKRVMDRFRDLLEETRLFLPESKAELINQIDDAHIQYLIVSDEEHFLMGVVFGAMLAGKSREEAIELALPWQPRDREAQETAEDYAASSAAPGCNCEANEETAEAMSESGARSRRCAPKAH